MGRFNLSAWAVAHRSLTGFLIALLFGTGLFAYQRLGRGSRPSERAETLVFRGRCWAAGKFSRHTRALALQRGQIAALKALGRDDREIGLHYLKFVLVIVLVTIVFTSVALRSATVCQNVDARNRSSRRSVAPATIDPESE